VAMTWAWFHRFGSPPYFYRVAGSIARWCAWPAALLMIVGLGWGLFVAPADALQSDAYRILFIHAPSAWLSTLSYSAMAVAAAVGLIWRIKIAHAIATAIAPAGATLTAMTLVTGMIWGQPMWGTYWAWDPRIIFELVLLFFFLGYIALRGAIEDQSRADRTSAVLAIVGAVNVPLVKYSVEWWNSIHQGPSVLRGGGPSMPGSMLTPLLIAFLGFTLYFIAVMLTRARAEVLRRERGGQWVRDMLANEGRKP
jgi:heme exporter protein C